jgi:hypothetical protein
MLSAYSGKCLSRKVVHSCVRNSLKGVRKSRRIFSSGIWHFVFRWLSHVLASHVLCLLPVSWCFLALDYSSTLKKESTCTAETYVNFQRNTRRFLLEVWTSNLSYYFLVCSVGILEQWNVKCWTRGSGIVSNELHNMQHLLETLFSGRTRFQKGAFGNRVNKL